MRGAFREYFVTIVLRHCPLGTPVRSPVELQKLSLVNSLFHFFESLIAQIQAGSDEIAEAEERLSFELYGAHPFLRPSAAISNQRRQADANNLESFLTFERDRRRLSAGQAGWLRKLLCLRQTTSGTEIYRLVASILSPAAMAPTIFPNSSSVGSRFICSRD